MEILIIPFPKTVSFKRFRHPSFAERLPNDINKEPIGVLFEIVITLYLFFSLLLQNQEILIQTKFSPTINLTEPFFKMVNHFLPLLMCYCEGYDDNSCWKHRILKLNP